MPAYDAGGNGVFGLYGSSCWNGFNGVQSPQPPVYPGFPANNTALETFAKTATNCFVAASVGGVQASNLTYAIWINPSGPVQN